MKNCCVYDYRTNGCGMCNADAENGFSVGTGNVDCTALCKADLNKGPEVKPLREECPGYFD